jgi:hypothetical protein
VGDTLLWIYLSIVVSWILAALSYSEYIKIQDKRQEKAGALSQ